MVSHSHPTHPLPTTPNTRPDYHRWVLGAALGISLMSIGASGILWTRARCLRHTET
jgi:hypothetical protein